MNPLETLIDQQAKLLRKMEQLMARDPSTEFARREGYVGATNAFVPCPKMDAFNLENTATANAQGQWVFNAQNYVQFWRVSNRRGTGVLPADFNAYFASVLKLEFDDNDQFQKASAYFVHYTPIVFPVSFTANTGFAIFTLDITVPIRKRFLRITCGKIVSGSAGEKSFAGGTGFTDANFQFNSPLLVNAFGE